MRQIGRRPALHEVQVMERRGPSVSVEALRMRRMDGDGVSRNGGNGG